MEKEILFNSVAPKVIGPYSPTLKIGNLIFVSGQIPTDPATGELVVGEIEIQTIRSLENIKSVLKPYSVDFNHIVKVTIFLRDMNHFSLVNKVYSQYFTDNYPARSCIEVSRLPKDAQIEIEAIAYCDEKEKAQKIQ